MFLVEIVVLPCRYTGFARLQLRAAPKIERNARNLAGDSRRRNEFLREMPPPAPRDELDF